MADDSIDDYFRAALSRRHFLAASSAAAAAATTATIPTAALAKATPPVSGKLPELDASAPGGIDLHIETKKLRVGGKPGKAIAINGAIPGPVIRMKEGEEALIRVHNHMDESTSIHWHGMLVPYNMDGVPGISFEGIAPGETFVYHYPVRQNGTYWYHSHTGLQEQKGHYGQLIVEPRDKDPVAYDVEHSIVLSDWTFDDPHDVLRNLKTMEGYYNFQRPTLANLRKQASEPGMTLGKAMKKRWQWNWMRMDPTDIADITGATYTYLMNGRASHENPTFLAEPGQRVRLRLANASTMTFYDFRIGGLPMTVVQADGQNVEPVEVDELRIAVAETYDVVVTVPDDSAYTLFAETMDRSGFARGTLAPRHGMSAPIPERRRRAMLTMADMGMMHSESGSMEMDGEDDGTDHSSHSSDDEAANMVPGAALPIHDLPTSVKHGPSEHGPASITMAKNAYRQLDDPGPGLGNDGRRVLTYGKLKALKPFHKRRAPTREIDLHLTGNMHKYIWGFDGVEWSDSKMLRFVYGERLRINLINETMMSHPIHLHGMWMDLYAGHDYAHNPRKHTVDVQPAELLTVDINVDAPGQWAFHCHLLYHMKAGMFRTVAVVRDLEGEPIDV
jgi:CopA family copper-resistance protein